MIGYFGAIPFEVSADKVQTFRDFTRTTAGRWNDQTVNLKKPIRTFAGPENDTITFVITLSRGLGVKPREMMNKFIDYARNGEAHVFSIGGNPLGVDRWTLDDVGQAYNYVLNDGSIYSCELSISLTEYVEGIE